MNLSDFFRIAEEIINRYHSLIHMESANLQLVQQLLDISQKSNVVQARGNPLSGKSSYKKCKMDSLESQSG